MSCQDYTYYLPKRHSLIARAAVDENLFTLEIPPADALSAYVNYLQRGIETYCPIFTQRLPRDVVFKVPTAMTYSQRIRQNLHPAKPELVLESIQTIYFNLLFLMYIKKHAARTEE